VIERLFSADTREFVRLLHAHDVRYLLIGGAAVIHHGYARLTADVDFLYDCRAANAERLWQALLEFWGGSVPAVENSDELTNPDLIVQFGRPPNRIDLIASLRTVPFDTAWHNRVRAEIPTDRGPMPVWIIGLAELRQAKVEAGRPKDLDDLGHLPSVP
jgi:hypothetical protein